MNIYDQKQISEQDAYQQGRDCGISGPNETNCHFSLFASPRLTKAWERGKREVEVELTLSATENPSILNARP